MSKKKIDYKSAGVDIDAGNNAVELIKDKVKSTHSKEVLTGIGSFGSLFNLKDVLVKYKEPVMVQSIDGVGTKTIIARKMNKFNTIGIDLLSACANDILVMGAKPLTFLDYIANDKLKPKIVAEIVEGMTHACRDTGVSLVGGETAQMPGFYKSGEYDVSGTIVGVVDKNRILDGSTIRPGDKIIGIASSGLHTNGYSLARKILFEKMKLKPSSKLPGLGIKVSDELLKVHVSYGPVVQKLLKKFNKGSRRTWGIKGLAHITGGGFIDNIPRVLPENCSAVILRDTWEVLPIFDLLKAKGELKINLSNQIPQEFIDYRWSSYWFALTNVVPFKRDVYRNVLTEFLPKYIQLHND
mgnify:CR=1 FL=1